jgi:hypothetical protein
MSKTDDFGYCGKKIAHNHNHNQSVDGFGPFISPRVYLISIARLCYPNLETTYIDFAAMCIFISVSVNTSSIFRNILVAFVMGYDIFVVKAFFFRCRNGCLFGSVVVYMRCSVSSKQGHVRLFLQVEF